MAESDKIILPRDCRKRMYYVITMPYNSAGHGPVSYEDCNGVTFEVWSQDLTTQDSFEYLPDAINFCEKLNEEFHNG